MRVLVAGATGVIGQHLVPGLITAGHEVTASTRSALKVHQLAGQGATPVIIDGLDREAVLKAVTAAQPEVIIHQMTALNRMKSFRNFDKEFAVTNELRSRGTDNLLEAAREAGTRRFIAQSFVGWTNGREGGTVKTEHDPLDSVAAVTRGTSGISSVVDDEPAPVAQWLPYLASSLGVKPPMRAAPVWLGRLLGGQMTVSMMIEVRGASNEKAKRVLDWTPAYPSWRDGFPVWAAAFKSGQAA